MVWWLADDDRLDPAAAEAIASPANAVAVSAASAWELAIKHASGKLETPDDLEARVEAAGMSRLDISFAHARAASALPRHHRDPFDRLLVAQAQLEGCTLVTSDPQIARYDVAVLTAG